MTEKTLNFKNIGYRVKMKRMQANLYQADLGKMLGISQTHMSNIEQGKAGVTLENLVRMANIFGCSLDNIVFGDAVDRELENESYSTFKDYTIEDLLKALQALKN